MRSAGLTSDPVYRWVDLPFISCGQWVSLYRTSLVRETWITTGFLIMHNI